MSVYIVDNIHTHAMIRFYDRYSKSLRSDKDCLKLEQSLIDWNYKSVNYRYKDNMAPHHAVWMEKYPTLTPVEVLKACDCLEYQSDEYPEYKDDTAYDLLQAIRTLAISMLPGYEEAQWEVTR